MEVMKHSTEAVSHSFKLEAEAILRIRSDIEQDIKTIHEKIAEKEKQGIDRYESLKLLAEVIIHMLFL